MNTKVNLYRQSDVYKDKLKKKIRQEFNSLAVLSFDELNVLNTRKKVKQIYDDIEEFNLMSYAEIFKFVVKETMKMLTPAEIHKLERYSDKEILMMVTGFLGMVNPVTGYLYTPELERKRLRLVEEILTSREVDSRERLNKALKRSADLMYTQSLQYADDVSDFAEKTVLENAGLEKVVWNTERDGKVCSECAAKDGKVFLISDAGLFKEHYHCRCYLTPYRDKKS